MCAALREMVQCEGVLPIRGYLPDMAADTTSYVTLQQIYQRHAQIQCEAIYRRASQLARSLGQSQEALTESEVIEFIRQYASLFLCSIGKKVLQACQ